MDTQLVCVIRFHICKLTRVGEQSTTSVGKVCFSKMTIFVNDCTLMGNFFFLGHLTLNNYRIRHPSLKCIKMVTLLCFLSHREVTRWFSAPNILCVSDKQCQHTIANSSCIVGLTTSVRDADSTKNWLVSINFPLFFKQGSFLGENSTTSIFYCCHFHQDAMTLNSWLGGESIVCVGASNHDSPVA